jgi:outer membrane protein assembly factor BamB
MKKTIGNSKITTISLVLLLTLSTVIISLPSAAAQQTQTTYPFLGVVPNPVGVNQVVLFHTGIFQQLQSVEMGWEDITISIQRPDGQYDYITGIKTDSTGGTGRTYTPTQVGTYTIMTQFPEQVLTAEKQVPTLPIGTVMLASESAPVSLVVQEEAIAYYPDSPLPTEYWTRPVDAQLRSWSAVSGNWLATTSSAPTVVPGNADAPEAPHILWTKVLEQGGMAGNPGSARADWSFSHGDAYEGKFTSRMIINGILIYTHRTSDRPLIWHAVDLHTGEELWNKVIMDNRSISMGQNLIWGNQNHHGVYAYFWVTIGSTWYAFDPLDGNWKFTVTNVPSGTTVTDDNGWIYRVGLSNSGTGYIWSMVDLIEPFEEPDSEAAGSWGPEGGIYWSRYDTFDAAETMEDGNLTVAAESAYISRFTFNSSQIYGSVSGFGSAVRATAFGDKVFGLQYTPSLGSTAINTWAISLQPGHEGAILFSKSWTAPDWWAEGGIQVEFEAVNLEEGAAVFWVKDTLQHYAFSTDTGDFMWGPTEPEYYMNYYGWTELGERPNIIWNGLFFSSGVGGVIYAFNLTDGSIVWTYEADDPYQEFLFSNNWWQFFQWIVDGKLYSNHIEHSADEPMPRGAPSLCLNATTGEIIWRANGLFRSTRWGGRNIIGDSIIVGMDTYDNRIYAVGKGPSAITAESTLIGVPQGTSVTVTGKVTDVSPGTKSESLMLRFPNGVPVVADESMADWMLYVYKQFEKPMGTVGVDVRIQVVDPAGNYAWIGTAETDPYGNYAYSFIPQMEGQYAIIASFVGSNSYFGCETTAYIMVDKATQMPAGYPGYEGPSAQDIANSVVASLPANPTPSEISNAVISNLPPYPEQQEVTIPEYTTVDILIIVLVALAIIICIVSFVVLNRKK